MRDPSEYAHLLPSVNEPLAEYLDPRSPEERNRDFESARQQLADAIEKAQFGSNRIARISVGKE